MAKSVYYTIEGKTYEVIRSTTNDTRPLIELLVDYLIYKEEQKDKKNGQKIINKEDS